MVCDHHVCCIPLVCALMYCPSSGEVRGLGVDDSGHLVSLPSCALSLSYKHCSGESVALLLLHLHIPDQPVVTLVRMFCPGIPFRLILCRQSNQARRSWLWLNDILCFSIKYCVACWLFSQVEIIVVSCPYFTIKHPTYKTNCYDGLVWPELYSSPRHLQTSFPHKLQTTKQNSLLLQHFCQISRNFAITGEESCDEAHIFWFQIFSIIWKILFLTWAVIFPDW